MTGSRREQTLKMADFASTVGAFLAGIGLGIWFASFIAPLATLLVIGGAVVHAIGMWAQHRLEVIVNPPWWIAFAYWSCWVLMAGGGAFLVVKAIAR